MRPWLSNRMLDRDQTLQHRHLAFTKAMNTCYCVSCATGCWLLPNFLPLFDPLLHPSQPVPGMFCPISINQELDSLWTTALSVASLPGIFSCWLLLACLIFQATSHFLSGDFSIWNGLLWFLSSKLSWWLVFVAMLLKLLVHTDLLGMLKCRSWLSRYRVKFETMHFQQAPWFCLCLWLHSEEPCSSALTLSHCCLRKLFVSGCLHLPSLEGLLIEPILFTYRPGARMASS